MEAFFKIKALAASLWLLASSVVGQGAEHTTAALTRAVRDFSSRAIRIDVSAVLQTPANIQKPTRIILTRKPELSAAASTASPAETLEKKPLRNPFQLPPKTERSAPKPSVKPIVSPPSPQNPIPSASPISTTLPQATPQITPSVGTAPDVSVGTLLISNNPPYVKMGSVIAFTAFIRDSSEAVVKNKTLEFVINGKEVLGATDANGNAFLQTQAPMGFVGTFDVHVSLYGKQAVFSTEVVDTKPSLSLSSFAFTTTGFHVRLRNAAAESVPNWQVTELRRDGSVMATKLTNELGVIEFDLPPREAGGHLYACADVKDIGKECREW